MPRRPSSASPSGSRRKAKMGPEYTALHSLVKDEGLHTVCQEAGCPNIFECWEDREATFLIGGSQCTRRCDFCQIDTGKPADYDTDEPRRVAESVTQDAPALRHRHGRRARRPARRGRLAARRDGAPHPRRATRAPASRSSRPTSPATPRSSREVFESRPEVFAHNVETVPRIFKRIRPAFRYERSLDVLTQARERGLITKSNLILGMGEEPAEVGPGAAGPARRRHRHHHDHPVPAAVAAAPARRALGQAGRVRRVQGGGRADRLPRCARRTARALVATGRGASGRSR